MYLGARLKKGSVSGTLHTVLENISGPIYLRKLKCLKILNEFKNNLLNNWDFRDHFLILNFMALLPTPGLNRLRSPQLRRNHGWRESFHLPSHTGKTEAPDRNFRKFSAAETRLLTTFAYKRFDIIKTLLKFCIRWLWFIRVYYTAKHNSGANTKMWYLKYRISWFLRPYKLILF